MHAVLPNRQQPRKTVAMQSDPPPSSVSELPRSRMRAGFAIWVLVGLCCLVEFGLFAADHGLIGTPRWRGLAYQNGAFWAGLLYDWRPNYAAQPWTMFVTYAFLHGGLGHLAGNMLTLVALGTFVQERAGQAGFLVIYFLSAIGGGAGFALLAQSPQPVVGASGALFGLAGALVFWDWSDRRRTGRRLWPVARTALFLVVLNLVLWWMLEGLLAWEVHLAGFVTGWVVAAAMSGRKWA